MSVNVVKLNYQNVINQVQMYVWVIRTWLHHPLFFIIPTYSSSSLMEYSLIVILVSVVFSVQVASDTLAGYS